MPLVRDQLLHAWDRLQAEGIPVADATGGSTSSLNEVHIGFLNTQ